MRRTLDSARIHFSRSMAVQNTAFRLYAILDAGSCSHRGLDMRQAAAALYAGGVRLFQYRDKGSEESTYLQNARALRETLPEDAFLLLNDHAHLVEASGADGVHVGQTDCTVSEARNLTGIGAILGVSTHSADQVLASSHADIDYIAIGPVFRTRTKVDAEPVVSLCGVQAARAVTNKPLVAIGGIGLGDARAVKTAGADAVAVISALLPPDGIPGMTRVAQDFLARLK